jgi:fused signal recognition particle receptor
VPFASLSKLVRGLARTRESLVARLRGVATDTRSAQTLEELEATLLAADLGPTLAGEIVERLRRQSPGAGELSSALRQVLRESCAAGTARGAAASPPAPVRPRVVLIVGVNGSGKTTTVGKLAALERAAGRRAMVVAADTFRAAAIDQLERWAERAQVELVRQREGADPAAVLFDALKAALARGVDTVLVDTAGRLHTKTNLMAELAKLSRIAGREVPGAPHDVLLVLDATTGQNGLAQAQEFARAAGLTGVVLAKLDGTAKGGVALAVQKELGVPIRYVGVGEAVDDLLEFDLEGFIDGLLGEPADSLTPGGKPTA